MLDLARSVGICIAIGVMLHRTASAQTLSRESLVAMEADVRLVLDSIELSQLEFCGQEPDVSYVLIRILPDRIHTRRIASDTAADRGRLALDDIGNDGNRYYHFGTWELIASQRPVPIPDDRRYIVQSPFTMTNDESGKWALHSVFMNESIVVVRWAADQWPAFNGHEEELYLVPTLWVDDAADRLDSMESRTAVTDERDPYLILGSVTAEDPALWDRAWEGEGLLNACLTLRVATLGDAHEALGFTGIDLVLSRVDGVESFEELYWMVVVYQALRYTRDRPLEVEQEVNPVRRLVQARFEALSSEHADPADPAMPPEPGSEGDYRARLQWMAEAGRFDPVPTLEEQHEAARARREAAEDGDLDE